MADVIRLLPDSIANQIAAGEVIQRPASVVKELMENSIDAGSTQIKLIIKDAGKTLIQVIDDGCGMSETDARMSFERHATSKIRAAKDLFSIKTMGFRGEAMASIAAIAQVEMKTRKHNEDVGVRLTIEGSEIKSQEPCQCNAGTSLAIKNLFYNVPARRNFLKTTTVEMRHIIDEFQRVALANSDIFFSLHHNGIEVFHLPESNLRQRIVNIFGQNSNKKLVPVLEETDALRLEGFVGKPEFAKKTRGEQFFFVNRRFIKSGYLNHALMGAYEDVLPKDTYPLYVIFIEIDPARIDINVHPTKQEIKFDDERLVYNYLKVSVRHALGQYSITPTLDFDQEQILNNHSLPSMGESRREANSSPPFLGSLGGDTSNSSSSEGERYETFSSKVNNSEIDSSNLQNWKKMYDGLDEFDQPQEDKIGNQPITIESGMSEVNQLDDGNHSFSKDVKPLFQIHSTYIVSHIKSGYILVDQQAAHERILYERYLSMLNEKEAMTQKELFPRNITLNPADAEILKDLLPQINLLGFDIQEFGKEAFVIHGVPADLKFSQDEQKVIEQLLEQYKTNRDLDLNISENVARAMARSSAIKKGQSLTQEEMRGLVDQLFACAMPFASPIGKKCFVTFELEELANKFGA
ncbi:MAG: DNA mismatch repair endonuclease MutL [Saprospiraceae bacterium]|nr:DNA mismatch repair endonuclease MutL [Saprospiraceae bacterium]MDG1433388.1 DNA mismatch repair endonuclease MutL [Saprospiraceae bacterium]MDG2419350.1 DNA mismatch repair endonuclease MutL [Saprospiraceae bacterium]